MPYDSILKTADLTGTLHTSQSIQKSSSSNMCKALSGLLGNIQPSLVSPSFKIAANFLFISLGSVALSYAETLFQPHDGEKEEAI